MIGFDVAKISDDSCGIWLLSGDEYGKRGGEEVLEIDDLAFGLIEISDARSLLGSSEGMSSWKRSDMLFEDREAFGV